MNIDIAVDLYYFASIIATKETRKRRQGKIFKQNIQKDCKGVGSIQQGENKFKNIVQQMKEWREGR